MSETKRPSAQMVVATIGSKDFKARIQASLPKNVDTDRFTRMTITAIQNNPDLLAADKDSLYLAILKCAETGLSPDGKEAALVVFNTKVGNNQWIKKVQFMPMVTGVIKKLGEVGVKCETESVYEFDSFEYEAGDNPRITHKPAKLGTDRGIMIGAYAILRMEGIATPYREVMSSKDIEAVRAQSRAPDSLMWTKFPGEGYRKTVLRRCAKRIPMRFEESLDKTLDADNETYDMESETPAATAETEHAQIEQKVAGDETVVATQVQQQPETVAEKIEPEQPAQTSKVIDPEPEKKPTRRQADKASAESKPAASSPPTRPRALEAALDSEESNEDIF